jgi:predicted nucleotidyltransferase
MGFLETRREEIATLCQKHGIKELYVFGSVLGEEFSPDSDVDFAVTFTRSGIEGSFTQYFDFKADMENLLSRRVDLVCLPSVRNKVFKAELDRTRELVYAA